VAVERKMSRKFLEDAFAGESMAHMKYLIFAEQAEKEGFPNIAKLFRAISREEPLHSARKAGQNAREPPGRDRGGDI